MVATEGPGPTPSGVAATDAAAADARPMTAVGGPAPWSRGAGVGHLGLLDGYDGASPGALLRTRDDFGIDNG